MEDNNIQKQIDLINKKLDIILEEIELQKKHRREMDDLKDDVMRVGKDLYQSAVIELEEVHDSINTGDILYLFKKLLRNLKNITKTFEKLESAKDFFDDVGPISRELIIDLMNKLDEFDRKGYFEFIRELSKATDNIVTSFTVEDAKHLAENIVTILNTVKNLTQPDILHAINNTVGVYQKLDIEISKEVSMFHLLKELNKPETRRGLAFAIQFLKSLSEQKGRNDFKQIETTK